MSRHGGRSTLTFQRACGRGDSAYADAEPYNSEPPRIQGFRHFLGEPERARRFKIYGDLDPLDSVESYRRLQTLMGRLAKCMSVSSNWPNDNGDAPNASDNPDIPSGYTYLLQLVAHDLVQTSVPVSIIQDTTTGITNSRQRGLRLDTIYGGGPLVCPFAYALDDKQDETRTKLRLMKTNPDGEIVQKGSPFRDISRVRPPDVNGEHRDIASDGGPRPSLTDPLIADPRNDAHFILSQMTALFHQLHNGIVDLLMSKPGRASSHWEAAHERYLCARAAATLVYRNVVRKDLMKRLLHEDIYRAYQDDNCDLLDTWGPDNDPGIPFEFSHAAFRFAHAMIRDTYRLNGIIEPVTLQEIVDTTSAKEPQNMPVSRNWLVQWSQFFEIDGSVPNLSHRIRPQLTGQLRNKAIFPPIIEQPDAAPVHGPDTTADLSVGIAYRDLMSGGLLGLWAVNALIEEVRQRRPQFVERSPLLSDDDYREQSIRRWLTARREVGGLDDDDIDSLSKDPPLVFFILFEANERSNGSKLGELGSILVAETIFRILRHEPVPTESSQGSLNDALARLSQRIFGDEACLADVRRIDDRKGEIETMAQLIQFTARCSDLEHAVPAFL
jgi:Animal haem peroxidase